MRKHTCSRIFVAASMTFLFQSNPLYAAQSQNASSRSFVADLAAGDDAAEGELRDSGTPGGFAFEPLGDVLDGSSLLISSEMLVLELDDGALEAESTGDYMNYCEGGGDPQAFADLAAWGPQPITPQLGELGIPVPVNPLAVWTGQTELLPGNPLAPTLATAIAVVLRGNTLGKGFLASVAGGFLQGGVGTFVLTNTAFPGGKAFSTTNDLPTVPENQASGLHAGAFDGSGNTFPNGHPSRSIVAPPFDGGLATALSDDQEKLLGRGSFWGESGSVSTIPPEAIPAGEGGLDIGGPFLLRSPLALIVSAWPTDPNAETTDATVSQPGTTAAGATGPACPGMDRLAGARTILDADYDARIDGCVGTAAQITTATSGGVDGALLTNIVDCAGMSAALLHPFTGQLFASELAAVSWNFLMAAALLSQPADLDQDEIPDIRDPLLDPAGGPEFANPSFIGANAPIPDDLFDPATPIAVGRCSLNQPQHCAMVVGLRSYTADASTWLWEVGAPYAVSSAEGSLAGYLGQTVHALGEIPSEGESALPILVAGACDAADLSVGSDTDLDGVCGAVDNCPTLANAGQEDGDDDGVGDVCDNCVDIANPRLGTQGEPTQESFQNTTGGQLDDDRDGFGNQCDAKYVGGAVVGGADLAELFASFNQARDGSTCGTSGSDPCAAFDLDNAGAFISGGDLRTAFGLFNQQPGPACDACPLP